MKNYLIIFFLFQIYCFHAFSSTGRMVMPYFEALKHYDYVVKGEVIGYIEQKDSPTKVAAFQIVVVNKMNQIISDTIWIKPRIPEEAWSNYKELSGFYYFSLRVRCNDFVYEPDSPYSMLKIENGKVFSTFTSFDIFLKHLLHLRKYRKMRTETFERVIIRKMKEKD